MRSGSRLVVVMALLLSACGGSGGNPSSAPRDSACQGASCAPEVDPPSAPLRCNGADASACPEGYRCVDDAADTCDPATGTECGGVCVLGEELPGCGMLTQQPCPVGSVCVDDPSDDCDAGLPADCPGVCKPEATGECGSDADCPALPAVCNICPDRSASCPSSRCDAGKCTIDVPPCPQEPKCGGIAGLPCADGFECVDDSSDECVPDRGDADCSGVCVRRPQEPLLCAGLAGLLCPPGLVCVDKPDDNCDETVVADCPGVCQPDVTEECTTDADCPALRAPCAICADGSEVCPKSWCEGGRCNVSFSSCEPALVCGVNGSGCNPGEACVIDPDAPCDPAAARAVCQGKCVTVDVPRPCGEDASTSCPPGYECGTPDGTVCDANGSGDGCAGVCIPSKPRECSSDSECVAATPCMPCPDGTFSCARAECRDGACAVVLDACTDPGFCGGIAGFPCPPGLTCVDNPNDECDPQQGGADCGGMCVREEKPARCGGIAGEQCPAGYECADVPGDDCDPTDGAADCLGICRPAPSPGCSSDADCFIGAPCRICPDGTAACPAASCVNGACQVEFGGCDADQM